MKLRLTNAAKFKNKTPTVENCVCPILFDRKVLFQSDNNINEMLVPVCQVRGLIKPIKQKDKLCLAE